MGIQERVKYPKCICFNMLASLLGGFIELGKKPLYFVPALIVMILNFGVLLLSIDNYFEFFYSVFVFGEVAESTLIELPFFLFTTYGVDLLLIGITMFISLGLGFYLLYVYSSLINGNEKNFVKAMSQNIGKVTEIIGLTFFVFFAMFLYATISYILFILSATLEGVGLLFLLIFLLWLVIGVYFYIKLAFTPVLMATERQKLKPALAATWKWSSGKTIKTAIFLAVLGAITGILNTFFSLVGDATGVDFIAVIILMVGLAFSNAYYNIAFIKYFLNSKT